MKNTSITMGTQSKTKSTRISNLGLPFRRYSMPETVMRKYSLKRQRSVQSPPEFGLSGTKDQGCQTDFSVFNCNNLDGATTKKAGSSHRLGVVNEKMMMRCSRCNRSSERRHSYSCKYNIVCSKCKQTWRKTSLPVSIISVSKGGEMLRKTNEICRVANKPLFQSGSSPENKIQFDIGKIIERSSDVESDLSREADNADVEAYGRFPMEPNIESELSRMESNQDTNRSENGNSEKSDEGELEHTPGRTTKTFEERILKMLDAYCPHMQCTLNMFMGSKRPHSEGSQRSHSSCDIKRPKSASARLPGSFLAGREANGDPRSDQVIGLNNGDVIVNLDGDDRSAGTQNILIIDHDNISSTENTPGSTTRECESCHGSCPKCCSQEFSDTPHTFSCCCTSPDTTIEMKTSSGLTSSSGTLDQTVSDLTGSTQDSTLSITSVTPEDKTQRLKSTSPLPIVLSSECIILNPIIPANDDLDTTGSSQVEEANIETSDGPFPTVINSETTLIEPLEKGYISKKDMHNYSVHFLDSGHSDSSDEMRKGKKHQIVKICDETDDNARQLDADACQKNLAEEKSELHEKGSDNKDSRETVGLTVNQFHRDRRKSVCPGALPGINAILEEEKTEIEQSISLINEAIGEQEVNSSDTCFNHPKPLACGTEKVNENAAQKQEVGGIVELVHEKSSQDRNGVLEKDFKSKSFTKADISTQFSGIPSIDDSNNNILTGFTDTNKCRENGKRKSRREKREAKLAEISDMVDDLEIRDAPIGSISATTYYEGLSDDFLVPRYSAAPRSVSMFVNTSSEYSSDSDLSFADSLEDRLSPVPERHLSEFNRYDNRLVRGEVTEIQMINECKHKRRTKRCYAYFVTLSGEQTSISVTTMPESIRNRLIMKEKQIRYLCHRKHSSKKIYCKRSAHRLCSKHRCKQKQTQTSPLPSGPAPVDQKAVTVLGPKDTASATGATAAMANGISTVSTGVQTAQNVSDKKEKKESDKEDCKVQNYDRIMIGFCSNNVETSIYYSQDVTAVKKTSGIGDENRSLRSRNQGVRNESNPSDREKTQHFSKDDLSKNSRRDNDIDEQICQILLSGLKDQENGHMVFVEETQTFYSKSNVKKISTSAQTTDGVKDTATLTDLSYDCQKNEKVANKPGQDLGNKKKLTALQKSEETLEKLQKINETLRKEIQETKLRCNQGTQVNLDKPSREPQSEVNGNSYGSLLNHANNFKQANFVEYRRPRQLEPSKSSSKIQSSKSSSRLAPKGISKRSSILLGSKFRQKFEAIPEEKSSGSFESTEDSAEATPRENSNSEKRFNVNDVKICRSATDCHLTQDEFLNENRRHTVGNLMMSDPDVIYERSTERRRNTVHGNMSVSNTQTLVNTEHLKRSAGNLNLNVSRRTGQIIGKRTSMMVGRFERLNGELKNGDASKMGHLDKYKGRAALETDEQEELLTLSRGWINFYLLRGDSQEVTSENGIHEEVFVRTPNTSPADYVDQQMNSKPMQGRNSSDEEMGQYTVHIHAAPESMRHNVKFPDVSLSQSLQNRNMHPQPDEINLPDISSPPQSSPSPATSRSPLQPKIDPQALPSLSLPLNGMRKARKSRSNGSSIMKHRDEQCLAASNARYDADLSPPNSPKSIMSRSGELACSEQSITSSSCGSESPKFLSEKRWNNHRQRRSLNTSANSWTVTVAGNQERNTDVEMKLAFSHSQDRQKSVGSSSQQWTLTVNSGKRDRSEEKPRDEAFQCLPDLDAHQHHHQIHKKGWKHAEQTTPSAEQLSLFWPAVQEIIEKNMILQNSARLDPEWTPEKNDDIKSNLSVTGWAITPEKKPRVPTQSERDLTRMHCARMMKQRQFNYA